MAIRELKKEVFIVPSTSAREGKKTHRTMLYCLELSLAL
jgi:hypothetical protein